MMMMMMMMMTTMMMMKNSPEISFGMQTEILLWKSKNTTENFRNNSEMFDTIHRQKRLTENQAYRWRTCKQKTLLHKWK